MPSYGPKSSQHISRLPPSLSKATALLVQTLAVVFFAVVAFFVAELMKSEAMQTTPAMGISMTWIYLMYPVIGGITLVHLIAGFGEIMGRRS